MAYASLVSFAQIVDEILNHDRYSVSLPQRQHLISVHRNLVLLQEFLEDFPEKAHNLEGEMRDAANEAEDRIEYRIWDQFRRHRGRVGYRFDDLEEVTEKIESLAEQVMNIQDSLRIKEQNSPAAAAATSTSSSRSAPIHKDVMIGFDDELIAIKDRLCGESSRLQVIPVVGMGGIGKTTLARNAFEDSLIREYFHVRAWVTVSQDFCAQELLLRLLVSIDESNEEKSGQSIELVEEKLYKSLKGKRYLVVMDDMWSIKAWEDVRMVLPDDGNGSRIMLTTRLLDVAAYPNPCTSLYEMHLMDADHSWDLLRHKVFMNQDCPPELEIIGREIASSCRGLPLAIVVIGGLLSMVSKTPASWGEIAENVKSTIASKDGHFEKILSLSYTRLPHHLRPCFLYMGGFPEDYEIRVSRLVKIWVAEGFLKRKIGSKSLEDEAEDYVEDLVKRSLIFVSKRKSNGKVKSCIVHDLVRDLCIRKAQEEKFLLHAEKVIPLSLENVRRVSLAHFEKDCLANITGPAIRTIKCFHCQGIAACSLGKYVLLRVLVAVYTSFMKITDESVYFSQQVPELIHLRYLDLFNSNRLPEAISNLQNLETIIIHAWKTSRDYPFGYVTLPSDIWKMPKLRHLICFFFGILPIPGNKFALENLQTLTLATNFRCSEQLVLKVPNLKKLGIFYYGNMKEDYELENLVYLHQLEKLKIKIYANFLCREKLNPNFPMTLKKLTLSGCRLPWEGIMIVGSLPNLEVLKLRDFAYKGSTWETDEGYFLQLKFLLIDKSDLQLWSTESSHFPRLKSLLLYRCWCLTGIPDVIGEIPTLELIEVDSGNKSLVESAKRIQEEQRSWGNDGLQVRWVHF